jgi:hypothetical protein
MNLLVAKSNNVAGVSEVLAGPEAPRSRLYLIVVI